MSVDALDPPSVESRSSVKTMTKLGGTKWVDSFSVLSLDVTDCDCDCDCNIVDVESTSNWFATAITKSKQKNNIGHTAMMFFVIVKETVYTVSLR